MIQNKLQNATLYILLIGSLVLLTAILYPYLSPLILAVTMAIVFKPVYKKILSRTKNQPVIASALTVLIVVVVVIIPLSFISVNIFNEIKQLYGGFQEGAFTTSLSHLSTTIQGFLDRYLPWLTFDIASTQKQFAEWIFSNLTVLFSSVAKIAFYSFIFIIALYYLFKDGHKFKENVYRLSPLKDEDDKLLIAKTELTINSVIRGSLLIAMLQGMIVGLGFYLFGVPQPILWGTVASIAALVPIAGTSLVIIPGVIYLLLTSASIVPTIGLTIWGMTFVHLGDNIIGPKLMGRGIKIHPLFILLSVVGGLNFFGPLGFILGPIVLSFVFTLLDIYSSANISDEKTN